VDQDSLVMGSYEHEKRTFGFRKRRGSLMTVSLSVRTCCVKLIMASSKFVGGFKHARFIHFVFIRFQILINQFCAFINDMY
jgi:hypothetical protein